MTLAELLVSTALGALLLTGLYSVAREGVRSKSLVRDTAEATYQARFALQRVAIAAKATAPQTLLPPAANSSGKWFDPVYFCINGASALIETTVTDTTCSSTQVIAERVTGFAATLPAGAGALDAVSAVVTLTMNVPDGGAPLVFAERMRLGGGTK